MKKPWTIRLTAPHLGNRTPRIGYAGGMPRFWTKFGARKQCRKLNALSHGLGLWKPVKTKEDAW